MMNDEEYLEQREDEHKEEITALESKLLLRDSTILMLSKDKEELESKLQYCEAIRDGLKSEVALLRGEIVELVNKEHASVASSDDIVLKLQSDNRRFVHDLSELQEDFTLLTDNYESGKIRISGYITEVAGLMRDAELAKEYQKQTQDVSMLRHEGLVVLKHYLGVLNGDIEVSEFDRDIVSKAVRTILL